MAAKWQKTEQNVIKYDPTVMPRALEGMLFISFKRIMHGKEVGGKIHAAKDASGYSLLCGGRTGEFSHDRNSGGIAFENGWFEPTDRSFTEFAFETDMPACKKCIAAQNRYERWEVEQRRPKLQSENERWQSEYRAYLDSAQWRELRYRVLERDGHKCQSCLSAPATQVHHMTYRYYNAGHDSALFLRSVCRACHDRISEIEGHGK